MNSLDKEILKGNYVKETIIDEMYVQDDIRLDSGTVLSIRKLEIGFAWKLL